MIRARAPPVLPNGKDAERVAGGMKGIVVLLVPALLVASASSAAATEPCEGNPIFCDLDRALHGAEAILQDQVAIVAALCAAGVYNASALLDGVPLGGGGAPPVDDASALARALRAIAQDQLAIAGALCASLP